MKNTTTRTIAMLGLFVVLAFAFVSAQAQVSGKMKVSIPFDFTAGNTKLTAGEYTIDRYSNRILIVRAVNYDKDLFVFVPFTVTRTERDVAGKLVFHRYGNEYFLAENWRANDSTGSAVSESAKERRLAQQLARTNEVRETVEIVATVR